MVNTTILQKKKKSFDKEIFDKKVKTKIKKTKSKKSLKETLDDRSIVKTNNQPPEKIKAPFVSPTKTTAIASKKTEMVETQPAQKSSRVKRGTGAIMYFTKDTEDAIVEYNEAFDQEIKNKIYNEKIKYAFEKIAENIFNTFKFSYNEVSPLKVQEEAVSHMVSNIDKYERGKGKAFSYFSIVAKHWFILENNNNYRRFKKHSTIAEQPDDIGEFIIEPENYNKTTEAREFISLMVKFWDANLKKCFSKQRDLEIASAVVEIFRNSNRIDIFNKKALYLYIREIANCQTQNITKVINKMKSTQKIILEEYLSSGTIESDEIESAE